MALDYSERKKTVFRESIVFALSMGAGAHVALGLILHSPETWDWNQTGFHIMLIGFSVYAAVQTSRLLWWVVRNKKQHSESTEA